VEGVEVLLGFVTMARKEGEEGEAAEGVAAFGGAWAGGGEECAVGLRGAGIAVAIEEGGVEGEGGGVAGIGLDGVLEGGECFAGLAAEFKIADAGGEVVGRGSGGQETGGESAGEDPKEPCCEHSSPLFSDRNQEIMVYDSTTRAESSCEQLVKNRGRGVGPRRESLMR
jgi:hypothetical protein